LVINSTENVENMKNVLREVEEILESSIQQKVKMTRYIDKLLKQKNREFAELQSKDTDSYSE
jgi:general secretion pathway protein A